MKVDYVDHMGTDLTTVNAARVSFAKRKTVFDDQDARLVRYLARHEHIMPFAHAMLSLRVSAPLLVARQLAKHQVGGVWSEESRRYIDDDPDHHRPDEWRGRADNVKQGSGLALDPADADLADAIFDTAMGTARQAYAALLKRGVAPEMARMVLPQATMTTWIWTGSLLFFARVCRLRQAADAQAETRQIANQIAAHCRRLFPVSWAALMDGGHE